jgi:hypothetical protein
MKEETLITGQHPTLSFSCFFLWTYKNKIFHEFAASQHGVSADHIQVGGS